MALVLIGVAPNAGRAEPADRFELPALVTTPGASEHTVALISHAIEPIVPHVDADIPLLDATGKALGPKLEERQFCELARAGAGVIAGTTYRVIGTMRTPQVWCPFYFPRYGRKMLVPVSTLGRSVFLRIDAPLGLGARDYRLVPWRSIATNGFALGTVLYVASLRGVPLGNGRAHDGYLFVADRLADAPSDVLAQTVPPEFKPASSVAVRRSAVVVHDTHVRARLDMQHRVSIPAPPVDPSFATLLN